MPDSPFLPSSLNPFAVLAARALSLESAYLFAWEQDHFEMRGAHGDAQVGEQLRRLPRESLKAGFPLAAAPEDVRGVLQALPGVQAGFVEPIKDEGRFVGVLVVLGSSPRTSEGMDGDVLAALAWNAGMLLRRVQSVGVSADTAGASGKTQRDLYVLVVEDDRVWRRMLRAMLKPDFESDEASNMAEAVAAARTKVYEAVLLDLNLAERHTGVEVMHAMWDMPHFRNVPIIACTSVTMPNDEQRYRGAGFSALLAKPFNRQRLHDVLHQVIDHPEPPVDPVDTPLPFEMSYDPAIRSWLDETIVAEKEALFDAQGLVQRASQDRDMTARVMRYVNHARPPGRAPIRAFDLATRELSVETLAQFVVIGMLERLFEVHDETGGRRVFTHLLRLSMASAAAARKIAEYLHVPANAAYVAGLFSQLGRMALLRQYPDRYPVLWFEGADQTAQNRTSFMTMMEPPMGQELILFGVDHIQIGTQIAHSWKLPDTITRALQYYRYPNQAQKQANRELAQVVGCAYHVGRSLLMSQNASEFNTSLHFEALRRAEELVGTRLDAEALLRHLTESEAELRAFANLALSSTEPL